MAQGDNQQHEGRKLDAVMVRMIDDGQAHYRRQGGMRWTSEKRTWSTT
jgi:hypothetical protein